MRKPYRPAPSEADRARARLALALVGAATGETARTDAAGRLYGQSGRMRRIAMYLTHSVFGWPVEQVGHAFGLTRTTASEACRWTEDERDQPRMDRFVEHLEDCLRRVFDLPEASR